MKGWHVVLGLVALLVLFFWAVGSKSADCEAQGKHIHYNVITKMMECD